MPSGLVWAPFIENLQAASRECNLMFACIGTSLVFNGVDLTYKCRREQHPHASLPLYLKRQTKKSWQLETIWGQQHIREIHPSSDGLPGFSTHHINIFSKLGKQESMPRLQGWKCRLDLGLPLTRQPQYLSLSPQALRNLARLPGS